MSASPPRTLCLGDALVDLVGERPGASLALNGFDPCAVAAGLSEAMHAAARACERWGAVD